MVIIIEITVENRLKWIVILLLNLEMIFMFLDFVQLNRQCSPFYCLNALDAFLLPPFNTLQASPRFPFILVLKIV